MLEASKAAFCTCSHLLARPGVRNVGLPHQQPVDSECPELSPFPGFHEQQPEPVPESQAARLPVLLICSPCPHPPPPTCPFLSLACQVPEKTCDKALANSGKLDQNTVKASLRLPSQRKCCLWSQWITPGLPGRGPTAAEDLHAK